MRHPRFFITTSLLALAVALGGCASPKAVKDLQNQVAELEQQNFELRKQLTETKVRLEIRNEALGRGSRAGSASLRFSVPGADATVADPKTPETPDTPQVFYSEPMTPADTGPASQPAAPVAARTEVPRLMSTAAKRLDDKESEAALALFRQIVSEYPNDPLADDAQFGSGECYFQMGRYEEAINEYRKVVNQFPFGDQVPFAFLKIGFAHLALEQRDLALDNFRNVSEAYPGTEAATVARQQIAHLSRLSSEGSGEKPRPPKH